MNPTTTPLLNSILEIPDLSSGARRALIGLISFRNKGNGKCCPSIATLGERLGGVPYSTLKRWLRELRLAGLLETTKHRGSNSYRIGLLKTRGKSQQDSSKVSPQDSSKVSPQEGSKMSPPKSRSLYEQTVLNRQGGTDAAASLRSVVAKPVEKAAAALPLFDEQPETPTPQAEAERLVAELMSVHPEPGNRPKAIGEVQRVLASGVATVDALRSSHERWRVRWATYTTGRFVPQLWRWVHDGDWEHPPVDRKPVQSETWIERREREYQESKEKSYRMYAENGMWDVLREYGGDELVEVWRAKVEIAS